MTRELSLLPGDQRASTVLPGRSTLRLLLICGGLLALVFLARWHYHKALHEQQASLQSASALQQQLELRSQSIQKQLGALQTAGGANRVDLVRGLTRSRVNWKQVILAIARSAEPGVTINSFSGTAPTSDSSSGDGSNIQISGQARNWVQVQNFVKRLRRQTESFSSVDLRRVSANEADPVSGKSRQVQWEASLALTPLPAMPDSGGEQ